MQPLRSSNFNSSGITFISFDLALTLSCPKTTPFAVAQALTRISAFLPQLRSCERRNFLPSIATIWPCVSLLTARIHVRKQRRNSLASRMAKTRPKVSCDGMPWGNAKKVRNHLRFAFAQSSTSTHVSAPQIAAQMAITRISESKCRLALPIRGSWTAAKCWAMDWAGRFAMAHLV